MTILVTGGGGFLGGAVVRQLVARGDRVRSFSRGTYPELDRIGVETHQGDLADHHAVFEAVAGCRAVVHVAARPGIWGHRNDFWRPNVLGTRHVIEACLEHGVSRLVYTSSPSVVHGEGSIEGGDESIPYPSRYQTHYPETKAEAEKMVLAANGPDLSTVSLRPHLIWGPGDTQLLPRMVQRARSGRLAIIGDGTNRIDTTFVEDAAAAHLLALDRLEPGAACAGRAYFITQGEPWPLKKIFNGLLRAAGAPEVTRHVSARTAHGIGMVLEWIYTLLRIRSEPPMTRFLAHQLSTAHWYDIGAARRDLGFEPSRTIEEGLSILART